MGRLTKTNGPPSRNIPLLLTGFRDPLLFVLFYACDISEVAIFSRVVFGVEGKGGGGLKHKRGAREVICFCTKNISNKVRQKNIPPGYSNKNRRQNKQNQEQRSQPFHTDSLCRYDIGQPKAIMTRYSKVWGRGGGGGACGFWCNVVRRQT